MFTGIIKLHGIVDALERRGAGTRLRVRLGEQPDALERGESIAVNGVCLTALPEADGFSADLSAETLDRSTLSKLTVGQRVNLERALAVGDRLGGHIVQGHVDTVGTLLSIVSQGEFALYRWSCPGEYESLVVPKGSIAVDGVSLTIVDPDRGSFGAALIPETLARTSLGDAAIGDRVNLEFDTMAKFARNLLAPYIPRTAG